MNNYDSVLAQLRAAGLVVDHLDIGRMRRCKVEGDRERRGWYSLHELTGNDGQPILVGSYGVWRGNDNNAQKVTIERGRLSDEQAAALKRRIAEDRKRADADRARDAERAAAEAARVWRQYLPGDGESDYLKRKGVKAFGVRWAPACNGTFAIPMLDGAGKIHGLQIIRGKDRPPGKLEKEYFPRGLAKKGRYHLIGVVRDLVLVCEGYATGATLHQATGLPVVVAFDAGNLQPVCEAIKKAYRSARILVCADDDYLTDGNPGCRAAESAALAVAGAWCKPVFLTDRAGKKLTDFNDLAALDGEQQVAAVIRAAVAAMSPGRAALPPARSPAVEGGGDGGVKPLLSVDEACERWALVYAGGGVMFDHQDRILVPKADVLDICVDHAWREWKLRPDRQVVTMDQVGFDPTGTDRRITCNLWGGWPTTPAHGICDRLLELLEYLCSGDLNHRDLYQWVLRWLAYPIQHPGAKMHSALVVHGPQGTGKSLFFEKYGSIFGDYFRVLGADAIEDKFNSDWAQKKLFILADEVLAKAEMYHIKNRLKGFITGATIRVNPKGVTAHTEANHMNIVFLSNEKLPLVLEHDDRRHCIIWTPPKLDKVFYDEVDAECQAGGIEALHHYLLNLDLGDFRPWSRPPDTHAKDDLIRLGLGSEERFIGDWLGGDTEHPVCPCGSMDLYQAYLRWCRHNGVGKPRESNHFLGHVAKLIGWSNQPRHVYDSTHYTGSTRPRRMVIPAADVLERHGRARPADLTQAQWLTGCFFDFAETVTRP